MVHYDEDVIVFHGELTECNIVDVYKNWLVIENLFINEEDLLP